MFWPVAARGVDDVAETLGNQCAAPLHSVAHVFTVVLCVSCCVPGGTSLLTQMRERLELDISAAAPGGTKVKVTAPVNPTERRHAVWIGAHG